MHRWHQHTQTGHPEPSEEHVQRDQPSVCGREDGHSSQQDAGTQRDQLLPEAGSEGGSHAQGHQHGGHEEETSRYQKVACV